MKISGLLSAMLLAYGGAQAAGLGKLSVQSALGQPLRAEIELMSVSKDELAGVRAQLAGRELFRQARIERAGALSNLEFDVEQRPNGQPVVRITSSTPIVEPFLDMLIELNWNTGRIIREYTILLDPPADGRTPPAAPAKVAVPVATQPAAAKEARTEPEARPEVQAPPKPAAPVRYGPVRPGETLRSVAAKVKGSDVTLEQMMAGLYLTNKAAFIDANMNLLKKGAVLKVPGSDAVHLQASPAKAMKMIQAHAAEWHAYRSKVADMAGAAPEVQQTPDGAGGRITPKVEDKAAPATQGKDVLKLSKGEPAGAARPDPKTQERLQALEEELASKSRALQESQDRVSQLERAVRDMQELLQLKSQTEAKPPEPAPAVVPPEAPVVAEPPAPAPAVPQPVAKPAAVPPPVSQAEEESSWISTFIRNPIYIGGVVAALLLSGLLWMMLAGNRRRQGLNKFEDSIMTGGEFKSGAVFNTGGTDAAAAGNNTEGSMLLTDFSRLGLGAIDTHEVDPIAEAEVYMAYGRDSQAEEILKEALDKDSSRHEIALKLLEIYAARKDALAFETTASELYAGLGGQDTPVWQRAAEMGRSIDPDNPLYRMAQGQSFASAPEAPAPVAPVAVTAAAAAAGAGFVAAQAMAAPEPVQPPAAAPAAAADEGLEFVSSKPVAPAPMEPEAAPELEALSLDFPTETPDAAPTLDWSAEAPASDFAVAEAPSEGLDFTPTLEPVTAAAEEPVSLDFESVSTPGLASLDFEAEPSAMDLAPELEPIDMAALDLSAPEDSGELPSLDLSGIDLDLDSAPGDDALATLGDLEFTPEAVLEIAPEPLADASLPDLDFAPAPAALVEAPAPEPGSDMDQALWEEVNTKLDLARAYMEMGDREGAREILQEVAQEGNATQQAEARTLLDEAG